MVELLTADENYNSNKIESYVQNAFHVLAISHCTHRKYYSFH